MISLLLLCACEKPKTELDKIIESGEIRIVTRNGPTTYFIGNNGATGLEYELASRFASFLNLELKLIVAKNAAEIINLIKQGDADIAAAALSSSDQTDKHIMYGPSYHWVTQQVIYRNGQRRPASLNDIYPEQLHIADGILQTIHVTELRNNYPSLSFRVHADKDNHELLEMIENTEILYTVAQSNELANARQFYPEIRAAFNLSLPQPLAWAMKKSDDHTVLSKLRKFKRKIVKSGELSDLIVQFYGPFEYFDYVDSRKFVDRFTKRLPRFRPLFEEAALEFNYDWRLLAAVSYQESHWNIKARSPTGVRGLMMLTLNTAKRVGVSNRLDPKQSIVGGTRYLAELVTRMPPGIKESDRIWFALAAYNVGPGHLEDARVITERQGKDPNAWEDVKQHLPLLSRRKWYKQTKHGYARGYEPVQYVEKIKKYYNLMVQLTQPELEPVVAEPAPESQLLETLIIDSPAL